MTMDINYIISVGMTKDWKQNNNNIYKYVSKYTYMKKLILSE